MPAKRQHIIVVGAGAFGGWTALSLLRAGARVTLFEAREAGNPLSSSGGESRVIRHVYRSRFYVDMTRRAMALWKEYDQRGNKALLHAKGVLFMSQGGDFLPAAREHMDSAGVEFEVLNNSDLARQYPQINFEGITWGLYEPGAGYLHANRACAAVRDDFIAQGGAYRIGTLMPGTIENGEMKGARLAGGEKIQAEQLVFACGPWLKELFRAVLAKRIQVTRQEVHFFRTPPGHEGELNRRLPVWADVGASFWYGIPGHDGLFKLADDSRGPETDPTTQRRAPTPASVQSARRYMEYRFPAMDGAEYVDSRVCQYSETPDEDFIVDRHPEAENTWLVGGGSGHGFKHGPAIGELVAANVLGTKSPVQRFSLDRFKNGF